MSSHNLGWLQKYRITFEMGFQTALEYRVNSAIALISAAYPIFIQTFLWTAIYGSSGEDQMFGYSYEQILAYTFLAGLVSKIVYTGFEYDIMDDVKTGKYSKFLVQPMGYFPFRIANFFGQKVPSLVMILGLMAFMLVGLNTFWGFSITFARVLIFLLTIVLAMSLNFLIFYCISAISFWAVEIGFLFSGIRIVIVLLSGGIFPLEVFGETFVKVSNFLPFKYTVSYPINVLNGVVPDAEIVPGMAVQCFWIVVIYLLAKALWRTAQDQYVAVGG